MRFVSNDEGAHLWR